MQYVIPHCSANVTSGLSINCLLFASCLFGHPDIVKFLIDECGCDPHYTDGHGLTSMHFTCMHSISFQVNSMQAMLERITVSKVTNIKEQGMLAYIWQVIITLISHFANGVKNDATAPNPHVSHSLRIDCNIASELDLNKFMIFKYLLVEQKCTTDCKDKDGYTPLHYACASGQRNIVQYLYREKLSDLVHTTNSGDTPLHLACKFSQLEITEFLLSTGECDPLCKNAEGMTPLEIATSVEISEILDHFCQGNYPLESVVKVFVLGDPLAGKSSLVQALQSNPGVITSLIGRLQRIKGVRQQTVGIDSLAMTLGML